MLFTEDAQELYARYGFKNIIHPEKFMEITHINMYRKTV